MTNNFDLKSIEDKPSGGSTFNLNGDWLRKMSITEDRYIYIYDYAPARSFALLYKFYYPNGNLKFGWRVLGSVKFGIAEYYNEDGTLEKLVDEDLKFGKIGPRELVDFMEKEEIIDRKNAKCLFINDSLPSNGYFYYKVMDVLRIRFIEATTDVNGNFIPSWWTIKFPLSMGEEGCIKQRHEVTYTINGETGEFTKTAKLALLRD